MKNCMDKDTILFVNNGKPGLAFNMDYYRTNYDMLSSKVIDPGKILYKMGVTSDTWIDFKRAIQTKTGTYQERLDKAFNDETCLIKDLREIPEASYYDADGFCFPISPYDGEYLSAYWLKRIPFNYDAVQYAFDGEDLVITFSEDDNVNNAFISINSMFYRFEIRDFHTVVFKNVKQLLTPIQTTGSDYGSYAVRVQAYAWQSLEKSAPMFPVSREEDWFTLEKPIEDNCFIIYQGVIYEYQLNYSNKTKFKLLNVDLSTVPLMNLNDIYVYKMTSTEANKEVRRFITRGIGNKYKDTVDFALPIQDSMILFNGIDNEYEIMDTASIFYPESLFSVRHVSNLSFVAQVNFMLDM